MALKDDLKKIIEDLETEKQAKGILATIQEEQIKALTPVFNSLADAMFQNFQDLSSRLIDEMVTQFSRIIKSTIIDTPKIDFKETNKLLTQINEGFEKPCEIKLTLK